MRKEIGIFLKGIMFFLMAPILILGIIWLLGGERFCDLETILFMLGICEILGALFAFFKDVERELPYHGKSDPLSTEENLTAFFQAKSIAKYNIRTEYKPKASCVLAGVISGVIFIIVSLLV